MSNRISDLLVRELYDWLHEDYDRAARFFDDMNWREGHHYCTNSFRYLRETGIYAIAQALIRQRMEE